jgi:hypothetical protein
MLRKLGDCLGRYKCYDGWTYAMQLLNTLENHTVLLVQTVTALVMLPLQICLSSTFVALTLLLSFGVVAHRIV